MPIAHWDFETRSVASLEQAGAWRYAADPTTEILCVGYAIDDGSTEIWTPGQPVLAATDDVELGCARCHRVHEHIRLGTKVHR